MKNRGHEFEGKGYTRGFGGGKGREKCCNYIILNILLKINVVSDLPLSWGDCSQKELMASMHTDPGSITGTAK